MRWGGAGPVPIACRQEPNAPRSRFAASPASHRRVFFFTISHALVSGSFCGAMDPQNYAESFLKAISVCVTLLCCLSAFTQQLCNTPAWRAPGGRHSCRIRMKLAFHRLHPKSVSAHRLCTSPALSCFSLPSPASRCACAASGCVSRPCRAALPSPPGFRRLLGRLTALLTWGCSPRGGRPAGKEQPCEHVPGPSCCRNKQPLCAGGWKLLVSAMGAAEAKTPRL